MKSPKTTAAAGVAAISGGLLMWGDPGEWMTTTLQVTLLGALGALGFWTQDK